jgi:hypothetical protein
MNGRQTLRIELLQAEQHTSDWPPEDAQGALDWFASKLARVPTEHRASARISIGSQGSYDGDYCATITITYDRPETDAEMARRDHQQALFVARKRTLELQALAALQAKYGSGS